MKKSVKILIIVLSLIIVGLVVFIVADKVINKNEQSNIIDNSISKDQYVKLDDNDGFYVKAIFGKWEPKYATKINDDEKISLSYVFGSGIKYGGYLTLNSDGTYTKYIGVYDEDSAEGTYVINENKITFTDKNGNHEYYEVYIDEESSVLRLKETTDMYVVYYEGYDENANVYNEAY